MENKVIESAFVIGICLVIIALFGYIISEMASIAALGDNLYYIITDLGG
jgi:hypothetical protein